MVKEISKVDLTLLKKLVGELESSLNTANGIRTAEADVHEYIIEMSRAQGLAAGVMKEASMLVLDIHQVSSEVQAPQVQNDLLDKLLGPLKGGGTN